MLAALLCTGREASLLLEQQRYATTALCLCPERPHKRSQIDDPRNSPYDLGYLNYMKLLNSDATDLDKRLFNSNADPASVPTQPNHIPTVGYLLDAIRRGQARFEYYSWFRYAGGGNGNQIELERKLFSRVGTHVPCLPNSRHSISNLTFSIPIVAFLLGSDPGHLDPNMQQRTVTTQQATQDRFALLHLHFRRQTVNGNSRFGVSQINIRHGSEVRGTRADPANNQNGNIGNIPANRGNVSTIGDPYKGRLVNPYINSTAFSNKIHTVMSC